MNQNLFKSRCFNEFKQRVVLIIVEESEDTADQINTLGPTERVQEERVVGLKYSHI